ncbi:MAG: FAD:protein FMN transferase [Candidatus Marinamargulisbacteria bacterium]
MPTTILALKKLFNKKYFFTSSFLLIGVGLWLSTPIYQTFSGQIFGTSYKVVVFAPRIITYVSRYQVHIDETFNQINTTFSTYTDDSELMRLNQSKGNQGAPVSDLLFTHFKRSIVLFRQLNGAWDPTLAPLSRQFNLQTSGGRQNDNRQPVYGFDNITLKQPNIIQKGADVIEFDFSSNAKGLAVDAIVQNLMNPLITGLFVDIGGEVRTVGTKQQELPWRVGIQSPDLSQTPIAIIELSNQSMASSGNYLNYVTRKNKNIGHILDPRTLAPVSHNLVSISIIANDCFTADTLATGLFVMGKEEAATWLSRHPTFPALLITEENGALTSHFYNGFDKYTN